MNLLELILTSIGLAMDAFAVSICKGLSVQHLRLRYYLATGAWFGGFQALMPILGFWLGASFSSYISAYDHWISFGLLAFVGIRMIKDGVSKEDDPELDGSFNVKTMFLLAIATSIDALAVGITFSLMPNVNVYGASALVGAITFGLSVVGLKIGNLFGARYKNVAEIVGGVILVLIGLKILLEHLGILQF